MDRHEIERLGREAIMNRMKADFRPVVEPSAIDPFSAVTMRGGRATQNFVALMIQNVELQQRFLQYADALRDEIPARQQGKFDDVIDQTLMSINDGATDNAEIALKEFQKLIKPVEQKEQQHSTWQKIWYWPEEPPEREDGRSWLQRVWEDF